MRVAITRNGGTIADPGSVQRLFSRKGVVELLKKQGKSQLDEDTLLEATLEAEPEDVIDNGEGFRILSDPANVVGIRKAVEAAGYDYESAEVEFVPSFEQEVPEVEQARKLFKLLDALEDLDDVQNVYSNDDVPDSVSEQLDDE